MPPGLSAIGRLVDAITRREIGPLQPLAGPDIDYIGVGGGDRQIADRAGRLVIKERSPGPTRVGRLPDAAIVDPNEEDIRLGWNADRADCSSGPEWADIAPAQLLPELLLINRRGDRLGDGGHRQQRDDREHGEGPGHRRLHSTFQMMTIHSAEFRAACGSAHPSSRPPRPPSPVQVRFRPQAG